MPFSALPRGAEVFIGPQTAGLLAALGPALESKDAIALVRGPAGSGKTTLVNYALDALYRKKKIVRVGRSPLNASDVLESLLVVLGVENRPVERELRLIFLDDALRQYREAGFKVVVVVEDAATAGADVLAELAMLTAAKTDESAGARMVLMGADAIEELLQQPELSKLSERITLQQYLNPLSGAETQGYLLHCFRNAGGDFNQLFKPDCAALLHKISAGNPRAINQLAEVVLRTAAEMSIEQISARFIAEVAVQIYDPDIHDFRFVANNAGAAQDQTEAVAKDIAKAECLEDLDDVTAETLFGADITEMAAQAIGGGD